MPLSNYPYTNLHEMNLDWIIPIIREFQEQYTGISTALDNAIAAITDKGEATVADLEALQAAIEETLNTLQASLLEGMQTTQTAYLAALESAKDTDVAAVNAASAAGLAAMQAFLESMPADVQEIIADLNDLYAAILSLRLERVAAGTLDHVMPLAKIKDAKVTSDNIFDRSRTESGRLDATGNVVENATYISSHFIPVQPSTLYYFNGYSDGGITTNVRSWVEYDANLNVLIYEDSVHTSKATSASTAYVRITIETIRRYMGYFGLKPYADVSDLAFKCQLPTSAIDYDFASAQHVADAQAPVFMVNMPSAFGWANNPLVGHLFTNGRDLYYTDYDITQHFPTGTVYYVSTAHGNNNNDGLTANTALKTIRAAFGKSDVGIIRILDGIFQREDVPLTTMNKSVTIEGADPNKRPIIYGGAPVTMTKTSGYTYTYQESTANVIDVYDSRNLNEYGYLRRYPKVNTIAEVDATPGSYAHISGKLYIHCYDNGAPNNNYIHRLTDNTGFDISGSNTLGLRNLIIIGGRRALYAHAESDSDNLNVFAENVDFYNSISNSYDTVMLQGTTLSIFKNCKALYSRKDGFNYHARNSIIPKAIEIDCIGRFNGISSSSANQGSTIHDGGKIIRLHGVYADNYGSNLAEEGEGSESYNIACASFASKASSDQNASYYAYQQVKVFLDGCFGYSSSYAMSGAGTFYVRNLAYDGTYKQDSTVVNRY